MSTGLIVGKFLPYHKGHKHLIDTAASQVDKLYVAVCMTQATESIIPASKRVSWLRDYHPRDWEVSIRLIDQDRLGLADEDSTGWGEWARKTFNPDVVFTSEAYGEPWAKAIGCRHVSVDLTRSTYPISGSKIRANPLSHLDMLMPHVRAWYVKRVAILGAESTGKTTLAKDLAWAFETRWVAEYGRLYTEIQPEPCEYVWTMQDFERICEMQNLLEDEYAGYANKVLICDTNSFVTTVFHDEYMGYHNDNLDWHWRAQRHYDLYIVTDLDTPFEQDDIGMRNPVARERMHEAYLRHVSDKPHIIVRGARDERVAHAVEEVERVTGIAPCLKEALAGKL